VDLNTLYRRSLTQYLEHSQCYSLQRHVLLCRTRWQHDLFINAPEAGCAAHLVAMLHLGLLFCWLCGGCKCHHGNVTVVQSTLHVISAALSVCRLRSSPCIPPLVLFWNWALFDMQPLHSVAKASQSLAQGRVPVLLAASL
jgi:hypothetical protein